MIALVHCVSVLTEDQGLGGILVQEDAPLLQEVSAVADNLDTTLGVVSVQLGQYIMVCWVWSLELHGSRRWNV